MFWPSQNWWVGFFSISRHDRPINQLQDAQVLQVAAQGEQVPSSSWNLQRFHQDWCHQMVENLYIDISRHCLNVTISFLFKSAWFLSYTTVSTIRDTSCIITAYVIAIDMTYSLPHIYRDIHSCSSLDIAQFAQVSVRCLVHFGLMAIPAIGKDMAYAPTNVECTPEKIQRIDTKHDGF